ncbi:4-hydroxythreonine-4-phosphate dehydrogenase, partial [Burkholderia sp. HAN2018]|nr:4-hydroxythreonine-4-phosphate dehydrogenase [Burkholderia sp. HAN2018]
MTTPALQIAITTGEPAGVGPELTVQALRDAAQRWPDAHFTVLGDAALLDARAAAVGADRATLAGSGPVS